MTARADAALAEVQQRGVWRIPGTGAQDPPPVLSVDEQIRVIALDAATRVFAGHPATADVIVSHADRYADWIRTGIKNPARTERR